MNQPNVQLCHEKGRAILRVNAILWTMIPSAPVEKNKGLANTSSPFKRPPAPSASASRAAKIPLLQAETMRNNINSKHLFLEANSIIVSPPLLQMFLSGLCVLQHFLVIYLLVLTSGLMAQGRLPKPQVLSPTSAAKPGKQGMGISTHGSSLYVDKSLLKKYSLQ